jgi:hypothetical protein
MKAEQSKSQLFTIRVWSEMDADNQRQWRGRLHHVPSGEIRHFRGWPALIPLMLDILHRYESIHRQDENHPSE